MNARPLSKLTQSSAAEACVGSALPDEAKALMGPQQGPSEYIHALLGAGMFSAAAQFLAFALPAREAVWWSCLCARTVTTEESDEASVAALQAAETWAFGPTEENRRACEAAAMVDGALEQAAGWAAQAAFWSSGSLSPEPNPPVPPTPDLTAKAVGAVIAIASLADPPEEEEQRLHNFLAWGMDIAAGGTGTGEA